MRLINLSWLYFPVSTSFHIGFPIKHDRLSVHNQVSINKYLLGTKLTPTDKPFTCISPIISHNKPLQQEL